MDTARLLVDPGAQRAEAGWVVFACLGVDGFAAGETGGALEMTGECLGVAQGWLGLGLGCAIGHPGEAGYEFCGCVSVVGIRAGIWICWGMREDCRGWRLWLVVWREDDIPVAEA